VIHSNLYVISRGHSVGLFDFHGLLQELRGTEALPAAVRLCPVREIGVIQGKESSLPILPPESAPTHCTLFCPALHVPTSVGKQEIPFFCGSDTFHRRTLSYHNDFSSPSNPYHANQGYVLTIRLKRICIHCCVLVTLAYPAVQNLLGPIPFHVWTARLNVMRTFIKYKVNKSDPLGQGIPDKTGRLRHKESHKVKHLFESTRDDRTANRLFS